MKLTPAERDLLLVAKSLEPGSGRERWKAYRVLLKKVEAERKAAGLLPWPNPPIPKPAKPGNAMALLMIKCDNPAFLELPLFEQDAWFSGVCALDAILALLRSPGFEALPAREQLAALFGKWPESQAA